MVDRKARDRYAELLRHFAAGNLTNDQYMDAASEILAAANRRDRVLRAVWNAAWMMYDDIKVHRLRGRYALNADGRRVVARWILFLYSPLEYQWPDKSMIGPAGCLLRICTLGLAGWALEPPSTRRLRRIGSTECWPFQCEGDFVAARRSPRLLRGVG